MICSLRLQRYLGSRCFFFLRAQNLQVCLQSCLALPSDSATVKARLHLHDQWEETRAVQLIQSYQDFVPASTDMIAADEICGMQEVDLNISRVVFFMNFKRQPSRRERANMNSGTLFIQAMGQT